QVAVGLGREAGADRRRVGQRVAMPFGGSRLAAPPPVEVLLRAQVFVDDRADEVAGTLGCLAAGCDFSHGTGRDGESSIVKGRRRSWPRASCGTCSRRQA